MKENRNALTRTISFLVWLTGVIVSLAVAFGMIDGILIIRLIPVGITVFFGWIVVATTLIGVILAITNYIWRS
jgi:hypothetical protein